jgi:S1-C subfamily serine protease
MRFPKTLFCAAVVLALFTAGLTARADDSFAPVTEQVNKRLVKIYGSGGYRGVPAYGSGVIISPDGHVLTIASQMLETRDLRVHMSTGERYTAQLIATEPDLDLAMIRISDGKNPIKTPEYFDAIADAARPIVDPGTGVLAFGNQFKIADRGEPMSVQRGVIMAYSKLRGRRGITDAPYDGAVYFTDTIMCNPGNAGGALVTRNGKQLLGLIGRELKNTLTETWVNYAMPLQATIDVKNEKGETKTLTLVDFVQKGLKGEGVVKAVETRHPKGSGKNLYTGIILVPDVVERTPPFVEEVIPNSPAMKAGLKPDDLIVYVDGNQVVSIKEFRERLDFLLPNNEVKVEVRRGDKLTTLTLKVEELPKKKPQ